MEEPTQTGSAENRINTSNGGNGERWVGGPREEGKWRKRGGVTRQQKSN